MLESGTAGLLACPQCDLLQRHGPAASQRGAHCQRCGALVLAPRNISVDRPLALALAAAQVFVLANVFPLVSMRIQGDFVSTTLLRAVWMLYEQHMALLAVLVLVTTVLAPAIQIGAMLTLLLCLRLGRGGRHIAGLFRLVQAFRAWGMIDVLMLGMLVSLVKLAALATIVPGIALWALATLLVLLTLLGTSCNTHDVWRWSGEQSA